MHKTDMSDEPRARSPSGWYSGMKDFGGHRGGLERTESHSGMIPCGGFVRAPKGAREAPGVAYHWAGGEL